MSGLKVLILDFSLRFEVGLLNVKNPIKSEKVILSEFLYSK